MAETAKIQKFDFRTEVPVGWTLKGLSAPQWDGANYFRRPVDSESTIAFFSVEPKFVQLEYQLYSPISPVHSVVSLNGKIIGEKTFPQEKFINHYKLGAFLPTGPIVLSIRYECVGASCSKQLRQYATQAFLADLPPDSSRQSIGLGVNRLWLNVPQSLLSMSGTGTVLFDGVHYFREVEDRVLSLSWVKARPLNMSFRVYAPEPFQVTTSVGGRVISVERGDKQNSVAPIVSLVPFPKTRSVELTVKCLGSGQPCGTIYFPQVSVKPEHSGLTDSGWASLLLLALVIILMLGSLFGFLNLAIPKLRPDVRG